MEKPHSAEIGLLAALALPIAASCLAAPGFHADKSYPALGLRMRVLASSEPSPMPPPQVFACTSSGSDGTETKQDLFSPSELWANNQCAGRWVDKSKNELLIGKPSAVPLPDGIGTPVNFGNGVVNRLVSREEFDAELEKAKKEFAEAEGNSGAGKEWVSAFTGIEAEEPQPLKPLPNLAYAAFVPTSDAKTLVWLFRTKGRGGEAPFFCAVVKIADGTSPMKVRRDFETQFLGHASALNGTGAVSAKMGQNVLGNGARRDAPPESSPERDAALASVANMKGWWYADARGYVILSDIRSTRGKRLVRWMQDNMPVLHDKLAELVPPAGDKKELNVVRVFEDRESYRRYLSGDMEWSVGCWSPMRRELVVLWVDDTGNAQETLWIIRHEGTHQYFFYALGQRQLSLWYNEGHACFMECANVDNQGNLKFRAKDCDRYEHLKRNLDAAAENIGQCVFADRGAFYGDDRSLNYTTAWALVWYLRMGLPKDSPFSSILDVYRDKVLETGDGAEATRAAFDNIDMDALKKEFRSYWAHK